MSNEAKQLSMSADNYCIAQQLVEKQALRQKNA
jgi:hypothetical protein